MIGFKTYEATEQMEIEVGAPFALNFDFSEATRHCLKVQVDLVRVESCHSDNVAYANVLEESIVTLGKQKGSIDAAVPRLLVPSFECSLLTVAYELRITFFCFEDQIDIFDSAAIKLGLNKLKMLKWSRPVRVRQNMALLRQVEEFQGLDGPGDLERAKPFAKNRLSSFMFSPKSAPLYKVVKI